MHRAMLWEGEHIAGALASEKARAAYAAVDVCAKVRQEIGRRVRVLVVDDLEVHRKLISAALTESCDYVDVVTASGGQEACELLDESFDVVLCDCVMPDVDGLALLRWLRCHPLLASRPFIMLSGRDEEADILSILNEGAAGFLVKPVDKQVLCRVLASILLDCQKDVP